MLYFYYGGFMKKEIKKQLAKKNKNKVNWGWIFKILFLSFIISILFSFTAEVTLPNVNVIWAIVIALVFIFVGVLFDMVGVAVTASDEAVFHSMSSNKVKGAKIAVKLKKNADKVSSFCQDVIGDVCGVVSGATGAIISLKFMEILKTDSIFVTLVVMGIISALTIGGKAIEKAIAINKSNEILYRFSYLLSYFTRR
jgi:CBS domain containing-hemolysin-like protein